MTCPFAIVKGLLVYCKLLKKYVSPLKHPCLFNYERCEVIREKRKCPYLEISEEKVGCKFIGGLVTYFCFSNFKDCPVYLRHVSLKQTKTVAVSSKPPKSCTKCPFYSKLTNKCVKLKVRIKDPNNPPCHLTQNT